MLQMGHMRCFYTRDFTMPHLFKEVMCRAAVRLDPGKGAWRRQSNGTIEELMAVSSSRL